ncbi:Trypanosomal VSG domain containing protein, putative [Trypanosoma equiperdum]|uniref:Trypanosomal VSG domain containing protein, putative n=1 Tax=Trypanosoma equiperdum TaxID=5694 RepID=A0A1G4I9N5_TRYEQ|nr:Trypanosomal VSG domain containing protein, putative [Trypanosoma equiperdum]
MNALGFFLVLLLHAADVQVHANIAKDDNAREFKVLCNLINLAQQPPKSKTSSDNIDDLTTSIVAINLTLADTNFTKLISKTKTQENFKSVDGAPKGGKELQKLEEHF